MLLLTNVVPPSEGIRHEEPETTVFLDGKRLGSGTLYVAETRLSWFDGSGMGFSLEYPSISLQAILHDLGVHPQEHLYMVVNSGMSDVPKKQSKAEEEDDEEGGGSSDSEHSSCPVSEIRFVPNDKASLKSMFSAMCECHALHPDSEDSDSDFEELGQEHLLDIYEEGMSYLSLKGQDTVESLEEVPEKPAAQQLHVAGVRTESTPTGLEGENQKDLGQPVERGELADADVDLCTDPDLVFQTRPLQQKGDPKPQGS
ncbi:methylosome subunit pICln-like isoform X2 [Brienomyrus brachyistius]|uniref:methylosome subunit pICln-like isoform X2 n=1 Tax=Brienomyrus brachyistius TaxID=42636 RepID=UPI0020B1C5A6|nr:methylosome subunit pICln-like isoform X2 [Brienomyrus brachyistius]